MRITCAWGDTVTLLLLQGNNAFFNTDTQIMTHWRRLHFVQVFKSPCISTSDRIIIYPSKVFGENGWVEIVNRIYIAKLEPFMFFLRAFWSAMFLYKSILYSALTFAHTRGLQQKLLLKIMEILTFLFAFDWINLQYFKPLKRDLDQNRTKVKSQLPNVTKCSLFLET